MRVRAWPVLALAVVALGAAPRRPETVTVKREGARLMKAARFFGEACREEVRPGQKVALLERKDGWARIAAPGGGACWLHESAWSDRKAGELVGDPTRASQRDVELAGRGFSEDEVRQYRAGRPELARAFQAVDDYLEHAPETPQAELTAFAAQGRLGGAP
jgi:hypothetical protein